MLLRLYAACDWTTVRRSTAIVRCFAICGQLRRFQRRCGYSFGDNIARASTLNPSMKSLAGTADFKLYEATATPEFANSEVEFALDFQPRAEWLGMVVEEETLGAYATAAIVALCIHEMTFFGFSEEQVTECKEEIGRRAEEVRSMSEAERQKFLIPAEEAFKHRGSP
jgi:hypothetical protein